jgi:hypothetical protein
MYGAIVRLGLFRTAMGRVLCIYLDLFIVATGSPYELRLQTSVSNFIFWWIVQDTEGSPILELTQVQVLLSARCIALLNWTSV